LCLKNVMNLRSLQKEKEKKTEKKRKKKERKGKKIKHCAPTELAPTDKMPMGCRTPIIETVRNTIWN
jgi:hypothetical protein